MGMAQNTTIFALGKRDRQVLDDLRVNSDVLQRLMGSFAIMLVDDAFEVRSFMEGQSMTDIPGLSGKVCYS